jgi:hypothetical protein
MKERSILFSAPMVRALLAGNKTQTRRVVKPQPPEDISGPMHCEMYSPTVYDRHGDAQPGPEIFGAYDDSGEWGACCPFGQPGDMLWVRESGYISRNHREPRASKIVVYSAGESAEVLARVKADQEMKPMPSIHMPRWASRITLEVTGVRVERLQEISDADALAEGVDRTNTSISGYAKERYRTLWEQINGPGSWEANPWVWVVEFRKLG